MITKFSKRLIVVALIACMGVRLNAMDDNGKKQHTYVPFTGKPTYGATFSNYTQSFFNGWGPTLTFLTGASAYCLRYDRQAPLKAAEWVKDTFVETPKLVAYPAAFLGLCCAYSYYKPRFESLVQKIKDRRFW